MLLQYTIVITAKTVPAQKLRNSLENAVFRRILPENIKKLWRTLAFLERLFYIYTQWHFFARKIVLWGRTSMIRL
jgi:hypothetical protein